MTKVYAGGGEYEIYLDSGKSFNLTQDEYNDIVNDSDTIEELRVDIDDYETSVGNLSVALESIQTEVKKWQDKEIKRPKYKAMIDDFADAINLIIEDNI